MEHEDEYSSDDKSLTEEYKESGENAEDADDHPDGSNRVMCCLVLILAINMVILLGLIYNPSFANRRTTGKHKECCCPPCEPVPGSMPAIPTTTTKNCTPVACSTTPVSTFRDTTNSSPTTESSVASTTTSLTTSSTTTTTTTTTTRPPRNFTLICVFEYVTRHLWGKTEQCTAYVWIRFFVYTISITDALVIQEKNVAWLPERRVYYYESQDMDALYDIKMPVKMSRAMVRFSHADWFVGMWGSTYARVMATLFGVYRAREALHKALRMDYGGGLSIRNFTGFAIINTPLHDSVLRLQSKDYRDMFRQNRWGPPVLEPDWLYMHTAAIYLIDNNVAEDENIRNLYGDADIVGISTHNSTDEPNTLSRSCPWYCTFKRASLPNPIYSPRKGVRGMVDILKDIPRVKKVLSNQTVCVSVTSAINFAQSNVREIDFIREIGGQDDTVQRYTRLRFMSRFRQDRHPPWKVYPVDRWKTGYSFENKSMTHLWRKNNAAGQMLTMFAYDQADTLGRKVEILLKEYPDDKCLLFEDLGDDSFSGTITTESGRKITFERYELLKAVAGEMTKRYGPAFPAKYY